MKPFRVEDRGKKYAVITPDGDVRCLVDDWYFATEIAYDCTRERYPMTSLKKGMKMTGRKAEVCPVRCIQTGKVYRSITEASRKTGIDHKTIGRDVHKTTKRVNLNRLTFEKVKP